MPEEAARGVSETCASCSLCVRERAARGTAPRPALSAASRPSGEDAPRRRVRVTKSPCASRHLISQRGDRSAPPPGRPALAEAAGAARALPPGGLQPRSLLPAGEAAPPLLANHREVRLRSAASTGSTSPPSSAAPRRRPAIPRRLAAAVQLTATSSPASTSRRWSRDRLPRAGAAARGGSGRAAHAGRATASAAECASPATTRPPAGHRLADHPHELMHLAAAAAVAAVPWRSTTAPRRFMRSSASSNRREDTRPASRSSPSRRRAQHQYIEERRSGPLVRWSGAAAGARRRLARGADEDHPLDLVEAAASARAA